MYTPRNRRLGLFLAGALTGALALAGCSSDDSTTTNTNASAGSDGSGGGEVSQEVQDIVEQYSAPPADIAQTEPLSKIPDQKSVAFIVCADPTCAILGDALEDTVSNLGWDYTGINAPATDFGSAVQQAVDQGVDYIAGTGSDIATFQSAFDNAEAAGIPYFSCYSSDIPAGEENNLYANCYDLTATTAYSRALTSWVINDSGANANIGVVDIPEFPTLAAQVTGVADSVAELCDTCTSTALDLTIDDLSSGGAPNAIVSFLQSNPDINYLYLTFGNFETGLGQALASAGLQDVKVVGVQPQQPQVQSLVNGESVAWVATPQENAMWTLADQMARVANGEWSSENERTAAVPPFYIIDSTEDAEAIADLTDGWPGPDGFKEQYLALWGVS